MGPRLLALLLLGALVGGCLGELGGTGPDDDASVPEPAGPPLPPSVPPPPSPSQRRATIQGAELALLTAQIAAPGTAVSSSQLPRGAVYEAAAGRLRWIPQVGQAGSYLLPLGAPPATETLLTIGPVSPSLLQQGPPGPYPDADVGYVFVHGKTTDDLCVNQKLRDEYWGASAAVIAPLESQRLVVCHDGRRRVAETAPAVAQQILKASCGRANKCILVTHSMGGLLVSHMFTHAGAARPGEPAELFSHAELYRRVKERTLLVVSLASAEGGSRSADIATGEDESTAGQAISMVVGLLGQNTDSTKNLVVKEATRVVAPLDQDPGVPFFMVAGYSPEVLTGGEALLSTVSTILAITPEAKSAFFAVALSALGSSQSAGSLFNGDLRYTLLDLLAQFGSRSDGMVSFRSACGVRSGEPLDGPGHDAALEPHLRYCASAPRRPGHHLWFAINLNHSEIITTPAACVKQASCAPLVPAQGAMVPPSWASSGASAIAIVRARLGTP